MRTRSHIGVRSLVLALLLSACPQQPMPHVRLSEDGQRRPSVVPGEPQRLPLRVAIAAVISPQATLDAYGPLLDYLGARLDRPVQILQRATYAEINELVRTGQADLAFFFCGSYVEGKREFGMELLVAPAV